MASPKRDFVLSIVAEWERGDYSSAAWADPEHEYVIVGGPFPCSWTGPRAMAQARARSPSSDSACNTT
jgi:hypothetical protein